MHSRLAVTGILAVCVPLITTAQPVYPLYVSTAGSDANPGVLSAPFRTVQHAIDVATPGSRVIVLEGRYTGPGNVNLDFRGKAITVEGRAPGDPACVRATILDAEGQGVVARFIHDEGPGTVLAGFTIAPGDRTRVAAGVRGFIEVSRKARPTTRNLRVEPRDSQSTASGFVAQTVGMSNGSPVGGRAWDGNNPFVQPAATTNYWGSGDVDGDGVVTSADAALAQQMVDGTLTPLPTADVDGSGVVDAADVALINGAVAGATLPAWWNKLTKQQRNAWLDKVMALEPTKNYTEWSWWFVCVQYSIQTQLHGSFYRNDLFGTPFGSGSTWFNIPLYSVNLSFGHAINAVLVGDDPLNINDWRFIEPQGDYEVFPTGGDFPSGSTADIFVPDQIQVGGTSYMGGHAAVSFQMGDNGVPSTISHSANLVLARPAPPSVVPDNRPDLWNPRVLPEGSGMLLFERQRADMTLADDIHLANLPYADPPSGKPLVLDTQYARLLDFAKGPDGAIHLLWMGGAGYIPGLFHGVLNTGTRTLANVSRITTGMREIHSGRILVTPAGDVHVFWGARASNLAAGYTTGVHWSMWNGSSWNAEQNVGPSGYFSDVAGSWHEPDAARYFFDVVTEQTGGILLVWAAFDDNMNVTLRNSRYNGTWSAAHDIEATGIAGGVALSRDAGGIVHLVYWRQGRYATYSSFGNLLHRTFNGSSWSDPDTVDGGENASTPHMVATSSALYLVWQRGTVMQRVPVWKRWANSAWGADHVLAVKDGADAYYPSMELLADGRLAIAWSSRSADRASIEMAFVQEVNLALGVSHTGTFTQGDSGDTYRITLTNAGSAATTGTITVTDALPAGLTATAISGSGWSCSLSPLSCTRSDSLGSTAAHPAITVTVNVAADAGSVTNTVTVSSSDQAIAGNPSASDVTNIAAKAVPVTISVAPATAIVYASQSRQFTATVGNTANTAVTWSLNPGGVGAVNASGLYTAPSSVSSQRVVTVTATSQADSSKQGSSSVTLYPPVSVSVAPAAVTLHASQTQQFAATVSNAADGSVNWSVNPPGTGSVSSSGLYTAPGTITGRKVIAVIATSRSDPSKSGSSSVTLNSSVAMSVTPSSATLYQLQTRQFAATVSGAAANSAVTWSLSPLGAGSVSASGFYTAPSSITVQKVVTLTATSQADPSKQSSSTLTLYPPVTVTVSPASLTLYASQSRQFTATVGNAVDGSVNWSITPAGTGSVNASGVYTAPASISSRKVISVVATSRLDPGKSAAASITLSPPVAVGLTPAAVSMGPSQKQQFSASVTNAASTAVAWSISPPVGAINATGVYTAPASITVTQTVTVTATSTSDNSKSATAKVTLMPDLAVGKKATQSSAGLAPASYAVDGNTDGNFNDHSVSSTGNNANAWWQVDLGASVSISSITIWNRTDSGQTLLNDYWVFVSNTPFAATDKPATLSKRAATWSSHQTTVPSPSATINAGVQGRYVRVQLTGTNYLNMAEVQVMGQPGH
ncbi:MAG: discoidin domain-containing protein [Acidobacteriia bacterium]|nr:discoidin domain-containing protein [Terriglobia bacterium]